MFESITRCVRGINTYRLHIGLVYYLLAELYLRNFTNFSAENRQLWGVVFISWILFQYLLNRLTDQVEDRVSQPAENLANDNRLVYSLLALFVIVPVWILISLHEPFVIYLLLFPFGLLYSLPMGKQKWRLKGVLFVKNIYAAVGWLLPIGFVVATHLRSPLLVPALSSSLGFMACVILAFELIWDIRDRAGDRAAGLQTVPTRFGLPVTKGLTILFLLIAYLIFWPNVPIHLVLNLLYVAAFAMLAEPQFPAGFYHGLIYGQIFFLLFLYP